MTTTEIFLFTLVLIFAVPYLVWRLARTDAWAPLVVVQIFAGIALGPGVLGQWWPEAWRAVFTPAVMQSINGLAWWAVMLFVWLAGVELDLRAAWRQRRDSGVTAGLAMAAPMALGCIAALLLPGAFWRGPQASELQFLLGVGMACAVTALPILVLFMDKLGFLRHTFGQRVLRYASLDDIVIWAVLALILADYARIVQQALFLLAFGGAAWAMRRAMPRLPVADRWYVSLIWLAAVSLGADWCGLHFMIGAFLAGAVLDAEWFGHEALDAARHHVLMLLMPVFFLSTGLRTHWAASGVMVLAAAALLLVASVAGKLIGVGLAGRWLGWPAGHAWVVGWLLQTKALIMIIFANVLLDKQLITADAFTALLLMALASTMLTIPIVRPKLAAVLRSS
jgi:Kef-type K+ transport system membrane component KefB